MTGLGLVVKVTRDSDGKQDDLIIPPSKFETEYGFGRWHHFVATYQFDGVSTNNNMQLYINGRLRPETESEYAWTHTANFSATIELGDRSPMSTQWGRGNYSFSFQIQFTF